MLVGLAPASISVLVTRPPSLHAARSPHGQLRQDMLHDLAAYLDAADAGHRPRSDRGGGHLRLAAPAVAARDRLQTLAAFACIRRSAYPAVEF